MNKQLAQIPRGETFKLAGYDWLILEHRPEDFVKETPPSTLVLMSQILKDELFDTGNSNDWRKSSAREYLNGEFLDELVGDLASGQSDSHILEAEVDLTARSLGNGLHAIENAISRLKAVV